MLTAVRRDVFRTVMIVVIVNLERVTVNQVSQVGCVSREHVRVVAMSAEFALMAFASVYRNGLV